MTLEGLDGRRWRLSIGRSGRLHSPRHQPLTIESKRSLSDEPAKTAKQRQRKLGEFHGPIRRDVDADADASDSVAAALRIEWQLHGDVLM